MGPPAGYSKTKCKSIKKNSNIDKINLFNTDISSVFIFTFFHVPSSFFKPKMFANIFTDISQKKSAQLQNLCNAVIRLL